MMPMRHFDEARRIWAEQVPARGQADTVLGELLRGIEKLRWEAQNNGNINWSDQFDRLADFIEETLAQSEAFDAAAVAEVHADMARLRNFEEPETDDEPYDRLSDRVVEWSRMQDGPVPRQHDPRRSI